MGIFYKKDLPTIHGVVLLTWSAAGLSMMTSAACLSDLEALCSPSAAITLALAFLAASASAAMALCSCSGTLAWLSFQIETNEMSSTVPDVLDLDSLHHDSPGLRAFIQNRLGGGKSEIVELLN